MTTTRLTRYDRTMLRLMNDRRAQAWYATVARRRLVVAAHITLTTEAPARILLLGGPPFGEDILMWWNFVARTHDEIAASRTQWQAESDRFGQVHGYPGPRLPAPEASPERE
jgi:redox-sensitive bicupin YhaK (pirin superfamily)